MKLEELEKLINSPDITQEQKRLIREVKLLMQLHNAKDSADVMHKITAIRLTESNRE